MEFNPKPKVGKKYLYQGQLITVIAFDKEFVTYTDSQGIEHSVNEINWNDYLKVKEYEEAKPEDHQDYSNENSHGTEKSRFKSNSFEKESPKTTFTLEYDETNGTLAVKEGDRIVQGPWVVAGKNGERGKSAYEEWAARQNPDHPGNFEDFVQSLRGANGDNGKNGASAFELWLAQQAPSQSGNINDFLNTLKGKDGDNGKNGASAYEMWLAQGNRGSEKDFFNALKGLNGKNGDKGISAYGLWIAQGNNGNEADFLASLKGLHGVDGRAGKDGESAYQIWRQEGNSGDEEDFLRWIQEARKGEQGEAGDTYIPHFDDQGNLFFRNQKGETTHPERIKGEPGKSGKSAYDLWKEAGNLGDEKTFLESLKGRDGQFPPFPEYGYKNVKDFNIPDIKISTRLISSTDEIIDTQTPEKIIDEHIQEIERIRELGRKRCNWFKEAMWWCAGADRRLLRICRGDHTKNVGLGTIILFTAMMATFSGFIAMELVFDSKAVAAVFAFCWGAMIFFLDRFITNTMYSDGKASISLNFPVFNTKIGRH